MLHIYRTSGDTDDVVYVEKGFEEIYRYIVLITVDEDSVLSYYWKAVGPKGYNSEKVIGEVKAWLNSFLKDEQVVKIKRFVAGLVKAFYLIRQIEQDNSFYTSNLKKIAEHGTVLSYSH